MILNLSISSALDTLPVLPHLMFTIVYEVAFSPFTLLMRKTEESVVMQLVSGGVPVCLTQKPKFFLYNLPAPITL